MKKVLLSLGCVIGGIFVCCIILILFLNYSMTANGRPKNLNIQKNEIMHCLEQKYPNIEFEIQNIEWSWVDNWYMAEIEARTQQPIVFKLYKYNYNNNEIREDLISELINKEMSIPDGELLDVWGTGKYGKRNEDSYQSDYMEIEWYEDEMTKIKLVNEAKNMFHIINENKIYPKMLYFKVKVEIPNENKNRNFSYLQYSINLANTDLSQQNENLISNVTIEKITD